MGMSEGTLSIERFLKHYRIEASMSGPMLVLRQNGRRYTAVRTDLATDNPVEFIRVLQGQFLAYDSCETFEDWCEAASFSQDDPAARQEWKRVRSDRNRFSSMFGEESLWTLVMMAA